MAVTTTMALTAMAVGTAVSAYGSYQQGKATERAMNYNAQVAEQNAKVAKDKAAYEAELQASKLRRAIGAQRAAQSGSGYLLSGTALDLQEDTTIQGEMDRLAILYGGEVESSNLKSEAQLARMQGKAAAQAGTTAAFGTLLSGAGQTYYAGNRMGHKWFV